MQDNNNDDDGDVVVEDNEISKQNGDVDSSNDDVSMLTETSTAASTLQWAGSVLTSASRLLRGSTSEEPPPDTVLEHVDSDIFLDAQEGESETFQVGAAELDDYIDFLQDAPREMTWSRRIALRLMNKPWYNPSLKDKNEEDEEPLLIPKEKPSLAKAWAHFEHVTLPRYIAKEKGPPKSLPQRCIRKCCKGSVQLDRAEPGEKTVPTRLYSPISTPLSQMGDFGLGIGLYFSSLRAITVMTFLAGLINIPNLMYFSGEDYSLQQPGVSWLVKGSAICTNTEWVPCPDCSSGDFEKNRFAFSEDGLKFALQNLCDGATLEQGFVNYGTLIFVIFGIFVMNAFQKRMEVKFDEDEQTAQDYSIIVTNPQPNATEPQEWKAFFEERFDDVHVTCCTVAVDNDLLVKSLVERRELYRTLEITLPPGTPTDNFQKLAGIAAKMERERNAFQRFLAMFSRGIPEIVARIAVLTAKVQGLAQLDYPATNVFVTFETEAAQRQVLSKLSLGKLAVQRNNVQDPQFKFQGKTLSVQEPDEPSNVRWQDLNVKFKQRLKPLITTTIATLGAIVLVAFIISVVNGVNTAWAAICIAIGNSVFPIFAKFLTNLEAHTSEGAKQTSLYFKIALFRWTNTAIVLTVITPFTATLENDGGVIEGIAAIFFAEIVTTNAIQLADPAGHFARHFMAPRGLTQDFMNLNMQGSVVELAERYTNMTKILFLCLWYCAIYPSAFFLCSFALLINYFSDRFSLMRTWARTPKLGTRIAKFSRKYFFSTALIAMAVVSAYAWTGFPYSNLCINDQTVSEQYANVDRVKDGNGNFFPVEVDPSDNTYRYCLQDLLRTPGQSFPALPKFQPEGDEWMTSDQEKLTAVYGWTSIGVMALMLVGIVWGLVMSIMSLFHRTYSPTGKDQGIRFSDVATVDTYIPQVFSGLFAYPLVACNVDGIDPDLFDWNHPDRPHSYYDITKDAASLLQQTNVKATHVFSKLAHWPPK